MKYSRIVLIGLLILAQLAASCTSTDTQVETTDTTTDTTTASVPETEPIYSAPDVDYGGAEFTIIDRDPITTRWIMSTYGDIRCDEESGEPINDALFKRNRQVEEELNIKLIPHLVGNTERANTLRTLVLAGDDSVDAAMIRGDNIPMLLNEPNLLINLHNIDTLNLSNPWWDQNFNDTFAFGGNQFICTGSMSLYTQLAPILVFFSEDLAQEYSIPNLYDLVREGKWTLDKMMEFSEMVATDLDGNTIMNEKDRYGTLTEYAQINNFIPASGIRYAVRNSDGTISPTLNNEKMVDLIQKIVPFINNSAVNCIANLFSANYSNVYYEMNIPMFKNNQCLFSPGQLLVFFEFRAMEADYGIIPLPKFDEEQDSYYSCHSITWTTMFCVPSTNKNADMAGHVAEALGYYSQQFVTPAVIDTSVHGKYLRNDDSAEMLDIVLNNILYDIGSTYDWGGCTYAMTTLAKSNSIDFASAYASLEPSIKSGIEATLKTLN